MMLYSLLCEQSHTFDAWFRDSQTFATQMTEQLVSCPVCNSVQVRKAITAANIAIAKKQEVEINSAKSSLSSQANKIPKDLINRQIIRELHKFVEKNCENVGRNFADQARKIHDGELLGKNIYGQATHEEAKELLEEGINVMALPTVPIADA